MKSQDIVSASSIFRDGDPWHVSRSVFDILISNLALCPEPATAGTVAQTIDALRPDKRQPQPGEELESMESFLFELWEVVIKTIVQFPAHGAEHTSLVSCVQALRALPQTNLIIWDTHISLWRELPLLGPRLAEYEASELSPRALFSDSETWIEDRQRWKSVIAFTTLLSDGDWKSYRDASRLFVWTLEDPLSHERDDRQPLNDQVDLSRTRNADGESLNFMLSLIDMWSARNGLQLLEACRTSCNDAQNPGSLFARSASNPQKYSMERWDFWKIRLESISDMKEVTHESHALAMTILGTMRGLEKLT